MGHPGGGGGVNRPLRGYTGHSGGYLCHRGYMGHRGYEGHSEGYKGHSEGYLGYSEG